MWPPALVALRSSLGRRRHPIQIIATLSGALPIEEGLIFNVPEAPVIILSADASAARLAERTRSRPWISVVSSGSGPHLIAGVERLRADFGIQRISAIGGRALAGRLTRAGLVSDLYLTTSPFRGGMPDTPLENAHGSARRLVVRKQSARGVLFEHFVYSGAHSP